MFKPEDPLKPPGKVFDEPWQAQVLAMADAMVQAGHFSAADWAETLGAELTLAQAEGRPDTLQSYFMAALLALEKLSANHVGISTEELRSRRDTWTRAYLNTPHGQPVLLKAGEPG